MVKIDEILSLSSGSEFTDACFQIFKFQYQNNVIYNEYIKLRKINIDKIKTIEQIPFLPIEFFRKYKITSSNKHYDEIFASSGTTGSNTSLHYVTDISVYKKSFKKCFTYFYGSPEDFCILALLPGYYERKDSSLIFMVNELMNLSNCIHNGFYLNNYTDLHDKLVELNITKTRILLIGVSFALLDFIEKYKIKLNNCIVMETGGMKGRREEITREDLHKKLKDGFGVNEVHSEYGMTELLSQAYSKGEGNYYTPPWMKILIRDTYDPLSYIETGKSGGINVIDLANINSISFIETQDIGKKNNDGSFEVLGRFDNSDVRGCNLLVME